MLFAFLALISLLPGRPGIDLSIYRIPSKKVEKVLLNLTLPHRYLLFQKMDTFFIAEYELSMEVKKGKKVIASDFWQFKEIAKNFEETQGSTEKIKKSVVFVVPKKSVKVKFQLKDLNSGGELVETTFNLTPIDRVSDLIPIDWSLYAEGKLKLTPIKSFSEGDTLFVYYSIMQGGEVKASFKIKKGVKVTPLTERKYKASQPVKDTLAFVMEGLSTCKYELIGEFKGEGWKERRSLTFTLYSFNFLSDREYKKLLEMISYIAKPEELKQMKKAKTEEREKLWKEFWKKRDPTPGTERNEFEEEYLDRVTYANEHFSYGGWPGYRTDRGIVYIKFGPPDEVESFPFEMDKYPYEVWTYYNYNLQFLFVDKSGIGEYELVYPRSYLFGY
jgi:GWxTD domain-containing protein